MSKYLIIDGYNAISKIPQLEAKKDISLEAARMFFIAMLQDFMSRKRIYNKIFIVFDSKEEVFGVSTSFHGSVEAIFATKDKDADGVIVDMLRKMPSKDRISVASDDNFVRNHTRVFGGEIVSIKELQQILLKKKLKSSKIKKKELEHSKVQDINKELREHWGL